MIIIKFKKLAETAILPTRNFDTDAGIDFYADNKLIEEINPGERKLIPTGIAWEPVLDDIISFDFNVYLKIEDRSGYALKKGLIVIGGIIDQEYRGEIKIILLNVSDSFFSIFKGDRIAQGIVLLTPKVQIVESKDINDTARGSGGFGSSGTRIMEE